MPPRRRQSERPKRSGPIFVSEAREAWVTVENDEFVIWRNENEDDTDSIKVGVNRNARLFVIDLTRMTEAELAATKKLFQMAFDLATPLVAERDRRARELHDQGIGTQHRIYRRPPVAVGIEGDLAQHPEGIQFRPSPVPRGVWNGRNSTGGLRGAGDDVAPDESPEGSTVDQPSSTQRAPELGEGDDW